MIMTQEDKFNKDDIDKFYKISHLNPFNLLQYLEESHCYAVSNIEMRERLIQEETRHLWKDEKVCVASSKKYIKQMKREMRIFQVRADILSHLIGKIRSGEFSDPDEDELIDDKMREEGKQLCRDMLDLLKGDNHAGSF